MKSLLAPSKTITLRLAIIFMMFLLVGCFNTIPDNIPGSTPEALSDAADKQRDSTEVIDNEATKILITSKEDKSKQSAGKIKEANVNLKNNVEVLEKEAESKKSLEEALVKASERIKELEEEDNKFVLWVCRISVTLGVLLTAVGAVIFIKSGMTQWEVGALGLSLTTAAGITMWFFANIIWFIIGIAVIALCGVLLWVFLRTDKVAESSVQVAEMLKKRIKRLQPIMDDDLNPNEKYVHYEDVMEIITDIFGDDTHAGIAGANQPDGVIAHITAKRKKIHKKVKSVYE